MARNPFGPVILSPEDFKAFERQFKRAKPNQAAIDSVRRGAAMAHEFVTRGFVTCRFPAENSADSPSEASAGNPATDDPIPNNPQADNSEGR